LARSGEKLMLDFLKCIDGASFEVKYDTYRNGNMVVEIEQNHNNKGWKPSGLMVTKASWWIYCMSPQAFIAVEVSRLKKYLEVNDGMELVTFARWTNNPTRGYLLEPEDVIKILSSELYDE